MFLSYMRTNLNETCFQLTSKEVHFGEEVPICAQDTKVYV